MTNKKSFVLYIDTLDCLNEFSDIQAGKLFKAIWKFQNGENTEFKSPELRIVFNWLKQQFLRDDMKYQTVVERNSRNGKKGGRPPKNPKIELETQKNPEEPRKADNVNINGTETDNVINKASESLIEFVNESNPVKEIEVNSTVFKNSIQEQDKLIFKVLEVNNYSPLGFEIREINELLLGIILLDDKIEVILKYFKEKHERPCLSLTDTKSLLNLK
jgi:hypothetical protein